MITKTSQPICFLLLQKIASTFSIIFVHYETIKRAAKNLLISKHSKMNDNTVMFSLLMKRKTDSQLNNTESKI